jgi:hypothetical protein
MARMVSSSVMGKTDGRRGHGQITMTEVNFPQFGAAAAFLRFLTGVNESFLHHCL